MIAYNICWYVLKTVQTILWKLNGTEAKCLRAKTDEGFSTSAHVLNIIWKRKLSDFADQNDFLCTHESFVHPDYVKKDEVSLYCITETDAVFVETIPGLNIYHSDTHPFLFFAQFENAVRVVTLPLASFHKIADDIGPPKLKVIMLQVTPRSGSTLLTQMLEAVPGTTSISEPDGLTSLWLLRTKFGSALYQRLMKDVIHVLCKPTSSPQICVVIKPRSFCLPQVEIINRCFPDFVHLFLFRDCWENVQSIHKMFVTIDSFQLKAALVCQRSKVLRWLFPGRANFVPNTVLVNEFTKELFPWVCDVEFQMNMSWVQFLVLLWAPSVALYIHFFKNKIPIACIRYEDILEDPKRFCHLLFKHCGISLDFIELACSAMEQDSQRGSFVSQDKIKAKNIKPLELTDTVRRDIDYILTRFHLPPIGEKLTLPGTII